jgi:hypothetical protein
MKAGAQVYQKPEVTKKGSAPEPVEAGCCLRSCGGSPAPQPKTRNDTVREILVKAMRQ